MRLIARLFLLAALLLAPVAARAQFDAQAVWGGTSTGSANAQAININNLRGVLPVGVAIRFVPGYTNSGAATLNIASIGATAVVKRSTTGYVAFSGREWVAGVETEVIYDGTYLVSNVVGQSAPAPVGATGVVAVISSNLSSVTVTAAQVVVAQSLSGASFSIPNFSETLNVSTTGAGGMDGITALAASDYVDIFAIENPGTGAVSILGCADSACTGQAVYANGGLPTGYTVSALLGVWPTDSLKSLKQGLLRNRTFYYGGASGFVNQVTGISATSGWTSRSLTGVPRAATAHLSWTGSTNLAANTIAWAFASDSSGTAANNVSTSNGNATNFTDTLMYNTIPIEGQITTSQANYYQFVSGGGLTGRWDVYGYRF